MQEWVIVLDAIDGEMRVARDDDWDPAVERVVRRLGACSKRAAVRELFRVLAECGGGWTAMEAPSAIGEEPPLATCLR